MSEHVKEGAVIRTKAGRLNFAFVLLIMGTAGAAYAAGGVWPAAYLAMSVASAPAALLARLRRRGTIRANATGLYLRDKLFAARDTLSQGSVVPTMNRTVFVRLTRRSIIYGPLEIPVADEAEGEAILAALLLDGAHAVADFELTTGTRRMLQKRVALFIGGFAAAIGLDAAVLLRGAQGLEPLAFVAVGLLIGVVALLALTVVLPQTLRITVGADGVRVTRRGIVGSKTTFYSYAAIDGVTFDKHDVHLHLVDGTVIAMHEPSEKEFENEAWQLSDRIEQQLEVARAAPATDARVVTRQGRTAREWIRGAAALRESQATFRHAVIPRDDLWRIVEDVTASATERAGAALALRPDLDEEARGRLRIAADACAAPKLRVALQSVATADEDQLVEAFEPLVDERTMPMRTMSK